ncbi:MAG: DUF1622 domain-containing protein [Cyanobacteria bacterium P01_A01_bin.84]
MEILVKNLNIVAVHICQLLALFVISIGIIKALLVYLRTAFSLSHTKESFLESRLQMGYSFSLGLSILVGGSILATTINPNWNDIARLTAIIAIRTLLNYLLLAAIEKGQFITNVSLNNPQ